jgi:hypothetical protein
LQDEEEVLRRDFLGGAEYEVAQVVSYLRDRFFDKKMASRGVCNELCLGLTEIHLNRHESHI